LKYFWWVLASLRRFYECVAEEFYHWLLFCLDLTLDQSNLIKVSKCLQTALEIRKVAGRAHITYGYIIKLRAFEASLDFIKDSFIVLARQHI
jgi:hypothetical protein